MDLALQFRCRKVVIFTDPKVQTLDGMNVVLESLERQNIDAIVYNQVRVEPNDVSFRHAIDFLSRTDYDAVVAFGGGSVMDTAKAANLYASHDGYEDFYDYVNAPIGKGLPIPAGIQLKPLIAIPTTAGTGSETTGVAIFDDTASRSKTGLASRSLKPTLGIVDPLHTRTLPPKVATYAGLDVLCHAMESYTALPYNQRPAPASPLQRPAYQGSNPVSDVWSLFALETCVEFLPKVLADTNDDEARGKLLLASTAAGIGFGNAGVHLCHGMSYPIASQVRGYVGYDHVDHALVPHGLSVIVNAPAVFEWTASADPDRHAKLARILASHRLGDDHATSVGLADEIRLFCERIHVPLGLRQFGYTAEDIPSLVQGTLPQHRVTKIAPKPVDRDVLTNLFMRALDDTH